jgi:plasmid stabilization system protein ParE
VTTRWHPSARAEADAAAAFYQAKRPGLGRRFLDSLQDALGRVETRPGIYPELAPEVRKCRLKTFPYAVIFRANGGIDIIAVMHLRREPGYWKDRC